MLGAGGAQNRPGNPALRQPARQISPLRDLWPAGDYGHFSWALVAVSWLVCVAAPLGVSVWQGRSWHGLPLVSVGVWLVLLRVARWTAPAARCDRLLLRGEYARAIALCERELSTEGPHAWRGTRRLAWLNRRTTALAGAGRLSEALVAALEAVAVRPDPQTLANCAECLLWLNRYQEAAEAARATLSLTRERSVAALAVLAHALLAEGRPAEAQAMAQAGMAEVETLLPFVKPAHHVALLAALCRAERSLEDSRRADKHLARLRKAAGRNPRLQAQAMTEEADELATRGAAEWDRAFELLERAAQQAPDYVCWYLLQPLTLHELRNDRRLMALAQQARADWIRSTGGARLPEHGAPPPTYVALELTSARERGYVRPAPYASWQVLAAQGAALTGTLSLLVWWTWRFFLAG